MPPKNGHRAETAKDRQWRLETEAVRAGVVRFQRLARASGAGSAIGRRFVRRYFIPLSKAVFNDQLSASSGAVNARKWQLPILVLDPRRTSYITLQTIFGTMGIDNRTRPMGSDRPAARLTAIAKSIGERCLLEHRLDRLCARERKLEKLIPKLVGATLFRARIRLKAIKQTRMKATDSVKKASIKTATKIIGKRLPGFIRADWERSRYDIHLGLRLVELAKGTGIVETSCEKIEGKKGTVSLVRFTLEASAMLEKAGQHVGLTPAPMFLPMIVPPANWTGLDGGGYLNNKETLSLQLIKSKPWNRAQTRRVLDDARIEPVLDAVNTLQSTGWKILHPVYGVLVEMMEKKRTLPGFRRLRKLSAWPARRDPEYGEKVAERIRVGKENRKSTRYKRFVIPAIQRICEEFKTDTIYFPYQLDFRGRAYPVPQTVHPQADDLGRALLVFANGKPLGEDSPK